MTKSAAKMSETDVVIFPVTFEKEQPRLNNLEIENQNTAVDEKSNKIDLEGRFARLKKSLRKRSVSIL
jgi:hypothetical protein